MANPPPDINAILAALNSNKPNGQSASVQSPVTPSSVNNLPNPNSSGTVPLPQPSSSGNFDLSSIKPVNSGSIGLNDAIAKARGIAAEKSASSGLFPTETSSTNWSAGRDSSNYRQRSRSPNRRDNYRDSYNPYRDERRDDRRNTYPRERSMSPVRGQGGRESRGGQESDSEIIHVDSNAVGLIIGKGGENMRRIETSSGARVQFITGPEGSGPKRQCRVSGTKRQRAEAIADIYRSQAENYNKGSYSSPTPGPPPPRQPPTPMNMPPPQEGERQQQIMVPDKTVGLIIGRGGETIRDLQERSGCHVNITSESKSVSGYRPVNLLGDARSSARAKEMIYEIVDSDTRASQNQGQRSRESYQSPPQPPNYGPSQYANAPADPYGGDQPKTTDAALVPSEAVGMIIGKGGETIKDMQNISGCKINVSQPQGADIQRHIELIGSRPAVEHAKRLIWEKVSSVRDKTNGGSSGAPSRGPDAGSYGGQYDGAGTYGQANPPAYGQPPPMAQQHLPPPQSSDSAPGDPYAVYGGYQNYIAMWQAYNQNQGSRPS